MRIAALVGSFAAGLFIGVFLGTLATKEEKAALPELPHGVRWQWNTDPVNEWRTTPLPPHPYTGWIS